MRRDAYFLAGLSPGPGGIVTVLTIDNAIDPAADTDPAGTVGPVWAAKGSQLASMSAAAEAWGWTAL